ncbi:MAG: LPS ABC transporter substrate-binding protein LptA [Variibacter sp.]|nr:LPS ABC transporter substrate-binding protein LptA [Variibacter sp.]
MTAGRRATRSRLRSRALAAAAIALWAGSASAQSTTVRPMPGASQDRNQPINIESGTLELREKEKTATFKDNVRLVQGDTVLECKVLVVHYADDPPQGGKARSAGPARPGGGQQQIKRLEAKGGVVVTQKDQTATGDSGVFDVESNTLVLIGNVVLTQGQNVVRGDRLWVDLNTNVSRVESGKSGDARVQGLFLPSSRDSARPQGEAPEARSAPRPQAGTAQSQNGAAEKDKARTPPARPLKLN